MLKKYFLLVGLSLVFGLWLVSAGAASQKVDPDVRPENLPAPVKAIRDRGVQIVTTFETEGGLKAYAGVMRMQPVAIYVTPDGEHAVLGTLLDADGKAVDRGKLEELVAGPISTQTWNQLEDAAWVAEGSDDAEQVVYEFTDANCPYCYMFWKQAQPWIESGQLQVRHILVGVISETSPNKAAAILGADNPAKAYLKNQKNFEDGGIEPMKNIPSKIRSKLISNQQLMQQFGIQGTPGIAYKDDDGHVQFWRGVPPEQQMEAVFGPK